MSITKSLNMSLGRYAGRIQRYDDLQSIEDAVAACFDTAQIKHDGQWVRVVIDGRKAEFFSRQCRHVGTRSVAKGCPSMTLIGEWINGTERAVGSPDEDDVVAFDIVALDGKVVAESLPYARRLDLIDHLAHYAEWLSPVASKPIGAAQRLWDSHVETGKAEGLIFRRSADTYSDAWLGRLKRQVTGDFVIMSAQEGTGKLAGTLGTLVCGLYHGTKLFEKVRLGGGMNAAVRADLWKRRHELRGLVVEARGYQMHASGALRHPQFVRFRDDKKARDCVAK
jgi:hypothetical protein